jgi:hypothetical protein
VPEPGTERLRGEARNEAIRATLEPLAPGERPRVVTFAAFLCLALGIANLAGAAADVGGDRPLLAGLAVLAFVLAVGLWRAEYWAAMGVQIAAAITAIYAFLSLLVASNLAAVLISLIALVGSGTLFWLMIRPLGRMQAPSRE